MAQLRVAIVTLLTLTPALLLAAPPAMADSVASPLALPMPLRDASLVWTGTYAYVFGGQTTGGASDLILRFDPAAGTFTTAGARLPVARGSTAAVWDPASKPGCPSGCAYVFGGDGLDDGFASWSDDILRYDPASDTITSMASLPRGRLSSAAVFDPRDRPDLGCDSGCAYVLAGSVAVGCCAASPSNEIVRYNTLRNTVSIVTATLPEATSGPSAFFDGSAAYVFGDGAASDPVMRFDPAAGSATAMSSQLRRDNAVVVWSGSYAYVLGGEASEPTRDVMRYHPGSDGLLAKAAKLPANLSGAVAFWDGTSAWVLGGRNATGAPQSAVLRYTLEPGAPRTPAAVVDAGDIRVTWTAPSPNSHDATITGYRVYRGTSPGAGTLVADLGPVLSWTDDDPTGGVRYHYTVRAVDANGESPPSAEVSAVVAIPPSEPLNVSAAGTSRTSVVVNWTRPASDGGVSSVSYQVWYGNTTEDLRAYTSTGALAVNVTGLQAGKPYLFAVRATTTAGTGPWAHVTGASIATPLPPTDIAAAAGPGAGEITVSFTAPVLEPDVPAITSYRIYKCTSAAPVTCSTFNETATTSGVVGGLARNTSYYFFVRSVNEVGESGWGGWGSAITFTTPGAPTSARANSTALDEIAVAWSPPTSNGGMAVTDYRVKRSINNGSFVPHAEVAAPATSFLDAGLQAGTFYKYAVSAVSPAGEGAAAIVGAATPSPPGLARSLTASRTSALGELALSWLAPASDGGRPVVGYTLHRGTAAGAYDVSFDVEGTTFLDTGLADAKRYHYAVTARNAVGDGARTADVNATTWAAAAPPAPTGLVARSGPAYGAVALNWTAPPANGAPPPSSYTVWRGEGPTGALVPVATTAGRWHNDTGLVDGAAYRYVVTATNLVGEGAASANVTGIARAPAVPNRLAHAGIAGIGTKAYVFGGLNGSAAPTDTILEYDSATGALKATRSLLPTPRYGATAVAVGDRIYVLGGKAWPLAFADVLVYDPANDTLTTHAATLPGGARSHIAAVHVAGKIRMYGGLTATGGNSCASHAFDPVTGASQVIAGACVGEATAVVDGNDIVVTGGCFSNIFPHCGRGVMRSAIGTNTSDVRSTGLDIGHIGGAVVFDGGQVVVLGGEDGSETNVIEEYDTGTNDAGALTHTLPQARAFMAAWFDGANVVVIGGWGCGSGVCSSTPVLVKLRPDPPARLVAAPVGDGDVLLDWDPPGDRTYTSLLRYHVWRQAEDGNWTLVGETSPSVTTFTDRARPLGLAAYAVTAVAMGAQESARTTATTLAVRLPTVGP